MGVQLLADLRDVMGDDDRIATTVLLGRLTSLDERPWGDWYGKPLTSRALAKLLRPYSIHSLTIRLYDDGTAKGFLRDQFESAWARYLPLYPSQGHNPHEHWENGDFRSVTGPPLLPIENGRNPALQTGCDAVTDRGATTGPGCLRCGAEAALGSTLCVSCKSAVLAYMEDGGRRGSE